jgi:hypothetical protein
LASDGVQQLFSTVTITVSINVKSNGDRPMKNYVSTNRVAAMLAAVFVLTSSIPGAFARGTVVHSGNVVHAQLYDSAGKPVNRLPARAYGLAPKKATCNGGPLGSKCTVQTGQPSTTSAATSTTLTSSTNARTIIIHSGNTVHPQLYDSAGKPVNRLPGRVLGQQPKKVACGLHGRTNFCQVI